MAGIKGQPTPKPSDAITAQTPKTEVDADLAAFEGLENDPDLAAFNSLEAPGAGQTQGVGQEVQAEQGLGSQLLSAGGTALDYTGRALDYAGGLTRTGLAASAGLVQGDPNKYVSEQDVYDAFKGKAKQSAVFLERAGVPELYSVDIPLFGKVSGRGVAGFVADIVTDPLTSVTKLAKQFPYISKMLQRAPVAVQKTALGAGKVLSKTEQVTPNTVAEALGRAVYKSSLSKIDAKVAAKAGLEGATAVADELLKAGAPIGSTAKLAQKVENVSEMFGTMRRQLYDDATQLGVTVDMAYPFKRAEAMIKDLRGLRGTQAHAEAAQELLDLYKVPGKMTLEQLSREKTALYNAVPKAEWGRAIEMRGTLNRFKSALAADMAEAIVHAGNKAQKGLGDAIEGINKRWGPLLDARDPLAKAAAKTVNHFGEMDKMVLSLGTLQNAAVKKALDLATTTTGRTAIGKALMQAGRAGIANRSYIDAVRAMHETNNPEEVK